MDDACKCVSAGRYLAEEEEACTRVHMRETWQDGDEAGGQKVKGEMRLQMVGSIRPYLGL